MSLFKDGAITTEEDLRAYESGILDVASTEGIDFDAKFDRAAREIGVELTAFFARQGQTDPVAANPYGYINPERMLGYVVVTEPLAQWHLMRTLALVYRDAYNSQLNDRYLGKWQEYVKLAEEARKNLMDVGIGMSLSPVAKARVPDCGLQNGGSLDGHTYIVQVQWQNAAGRTGQASEAVSTVTLPGTLLTVSPLNPPDKIAGWNVYVALAGNAPARQNPLLVAPGRTWTMPVAGLIDGPPAAGLLLPDYFAVRKRNILRG